jgi:hypothetical protein
MATMDAMHGPGSPAAMVGMATNPRLHAEHLANTLGAVRGAGDIGADEHHRAIEGILATLPAQFHPLIPQILQHHSRYMYRIFAAAAAAVLVTEELKPNSGVTFMPSSLSLGASATPGTPYVMVPWASGAPLATFSFVEDQMFCGAMTHYIDAAAGWMIQKDTMALAIDPLPGLHYSDVAFGALESDVVAGRELTAEYEKRTIIEQVTFNVGAVLYGAAAPMRQGITVRFWDGRCKRGPQHRRYWRQAEMWGFKEVVDSIIGRVQSGFRGRGLFEGLALTG